MPHPYTTTVQGLNTLIEQLRIECPPTLTPDTLRVWNIGRSNESSLLATLRFLGVAGDGRQTLAEAHAVFTAPNEHEFTTGFGSMIRTAYGSLFDRFGDDAWILSRDELVAFMREVDGTSARVADQQAVTFQALARHAGRAPILHRAIPPAARQSVAPNHKQPDAKRRQSIQFLSRRPRTSPTEQHPARPVATEPAREKRLTININLPASADPAAYERIFRSIRQHLVDEFVNSGLELTITGTPGNHPHLPSEVLREGDSK